MGILRVYLYQVERLEGMYNEAEARFAVPRSLSRVVIENLTFRADG
jgi:hypothetical protein